MVYCLTGRNSTSSLLMHYFLAGDTAQAISQDSTFQFSDIKRLFHEHFSASGAAANQKDIAQMEKFSLSKNYRSHHGILAVASFVMALLWKGTHLSLSEILQTPVDKIRLSTNGRQVTA